MQSPDLNQNYFELFGLPTVFAIDRKQLLAAQQHLQSSYHPDRHVNENDRDRRLSVQVASWINQAYETLQDPVKRSRYLLEISGADIPDDSTTTADTEFLMEQIELREAVEACRQAEDGLQQCQQIENRLAQRATELADQFVACFEADDLGAAVTQSRKMQFIQRIQQQLDELQFELEGL
jgi:molecular chaperone HscB